MAAFSKCSTGLSFQCAIALAPLANTLVIDGEFFSCSVEAGFILALPFHHGDLAVWEFWLTIMLLVVYGWAYVRDKIPVQELWLKMFGRLICEGGVYVGHYSILLHEWRAVQENIQFKAGSIGPTIGRANTEVENRIFSCTARPKECNNIFIMTITSFM